MSDDKIIIYCPLAVALTSNKNFNLNLNEYRNAHYYSLNKAKVTFKEVVQSQIDTLPLCNIIEIDYVLYTRSSRLVDINNLISITDKFLCDAIVESGKLPDDNYNHLPRTSSFFGGIDRSNPRIEAHIVIKELQPMKVSTKTVVDLDKSDFFQAMKEYIENHIPGANDPTSQVDVKINPDLTAQVTVTSGAEPRKEQAPVATPKASETAPLPNPTETVPVVASPVEATVGAPAKKEETSSIFDTETKAPASNTGSIFDFGE